MHLLTLFSSLGLLVTTLASPLPELEDRAAAKKYHFRVESNGGSKKFVGTYLSFSQYHSSPTKIVLVPGDTTPADGNIFTVTNGSVHTKVPPNMVITSGQHSTNNVPFGDFVYLTPGKGSNDYFTVASNRLSFKPQPMGPGDGDFQLCPFAENGKLYALSLGAAGNGKGCEKIFVGAIPV